MMSPALSAIIMVGALMLPATTSGMTEASATRTFSSPITFRSGVTTLPASSAAPIRQVPTG